jgi:4-hydroxy-tetrahydrodipicolinate reductase
MKIALIGYGKMGKAIETIAIAKGHHVVLKIGDENLDDFTKTNIQTADVCIEFSTPETAFENVKMCLESGIATVCGSTAWLDKLPLANQICLENDAAFLYASNFSIGVNLFFKINEWVAKLMNTHQDYDVSIEEIHHTQKKDAPSGTAVTLAEGIIKNNDAKQHWVNIESPKKEALTIISQRIDPAPGTHTIQYKSFIDDITLTHTAHNREGFARGALAAAEFLHNKKGIFTMSDVLRL